MTDTTAELVAALQGGRWRAQPGHVEPVPMATADDPVSQILAALPAEVPTTPVPDAVTAGETVGELTPGGPDWGPAPAEELALAQPAAVAPGAPPEGTGASTPPEPAVTILNVPPAELQVGDIVQLFAGPVSLVVQNADLWVGSDCSLRYFSHLPAIPIIRP